MIAERLRKSILQAAIEGKLTEQLPEDGDARDLLADIKAEKAQLIKGGKIKKEKALPEIAEDEIPFDIPENWCWIRVGEISVFINGDRSSAYPKSTDYVNDGVPFFGAADMVEGKLSYKEVRYISEKKFASLRSGKLKNEDLVCLLRGSIGKTAKFKETEKYDTGFINAQMVIIRVINRCSINYIEQVLNSDYFDKFISGVYTGTAVKQLPAETLRQILVPLPPLREQNQIVDTLKAMRPQLSNLEQDETKLDILQKAFPKKMKNSLLQSAIQGKLTERLESDGDARDLVEKIQKEKARLIEEKKIKKEKDLPEITDDEIPFDIPENWCWVRLGEISDYGIGKQVNQNNIAPSSWILELEDIEKETFKLIRKKFDRIPGSLKNKFNAGDVLYGKLRPYLTKVIIADESGYCSTEIIPFRGYGNINASYLKYCMVAPSIDSYINQITHGMDMPRLGSDKARLLLLPLPPLAEQYRIVERLDQLLPLCDTLE